MASERGLPEIPGMRYDAARNRYFRITQDNWGPAAAPVQLREGTNSFKPPRVPTLSRVLRRAEEGRDAVDAQSLSTTLLANAKPLSFHPDDGYAQGTSNINRADSIPLLMGNRKVMICEYPTLRIEGQAVLDYDLLDVDWCGPRGLLAGTTSVLHGNKLLYGLLVCELGKFRDTGLTPVATSTSVGFGMYIYAFAIGTPLGCIISGKGATWIIPECPPPIVDNSEMQAYQFPRFPHPDTSPGLSLIATGNDVFTGTRAGHVYQWDIRRKSRPVCTFRPSGAQCSVTDLKLGADGHKLYASCMRNKRNNLAQWDMRMCDTNQDPVVVFVGHVNSHKRMKFDVDETGSGGLLLAGGDDSTVRIWNTRTGGPAAGCRQFPDELPWRVKLAGWGSDESDVPPGAWVITNKGAHVMVSRRCS